MIMQAVVMDVQRERLLVLDLETRQQVLVNTPEARWFSPGNLVLIWYNGVMTKSIPPQIQAIRVTAMAPEAPRPPVIIPPVIRPPAVRPPSVRPPVIIPPVIRPPAVRPPSGRPPVGRPPHGRPGGPRPPRGRQR